MTWTWQSPRLSWMRCRPCDLEDELVERPIPEPGPNEVLIKVQACGICHGDAVAKDGHWPGLQYPRVPGHEVVGIVAQLGPGVPRWQIGQRVGIGWYGGPCLKCDACRMGDLANCENFLTTGLHIDGGYAEYMKAPALALTSIPDVFDTLEAAPLLCAGRTTFTALQHSGAKAGDLVAIQGLGGLGHLGLQFAKKLGFRTVVLSRGREKEALAYQLGADHYVDATTSKAADELSKLGGAKVILATAPSSQAMASVINGLGRGWPAHHRRRVIRADDDTAGAAFGGCRSIHGWVGGSERGFRDAIEFSADCGVRPMIEVFPLEQAALAYEKMITAKVHFRSVLKIAG